MFKRGPVNVVEVIETAPLKGMPLINDSNLIYHYGQVAGTSNCLALQRSSAPYFLYFRLLPSP